MKTNRPDLIKTLVRGAVYALIFVAIVWGGAYFSLPERERDLIAFLEGRILLFGGLSSVAVAAAITFWTTRRLQDEFGERGFEDFDLARKWTRFLRDHHVLFGWLAFATATAHAVYFAVDSPALTAHALTGWAAWAVMISLVAAGTRLSRSMSSKGGKGNVRTRRMVHGTLAVSFVVALSLHSPFPAVAFGVWILIAVFTVFVWWKKRSRRNMEDEESTR